MIEIDNLIKEALKSKNNIELKAYRNLKSKILEFKTAKNSKPYTEEEELKLISKEVKKLEDAVLEFSQASRDDLALEYREELEVLKKLLPEPVDTSEIYSELSSWCYKNGLFTTDTTAKIIPEIPKKEMGNAIKYLKSKFPTVDGKIISEIVKEYIICM